LQLKSIENEFEIYDSSVTVQQVVTLKFWILISVYLEFDILQPFVLRFTDAIIQPNFQFHRGDVIEISNDFRDSIRLIIVKEIDQIVGYFKFVTHLKTFF